MSLGTYGSANEARKALRERTWNKPLEVQAPSVVIYQRDADDRQFYALASLPLLTTSTSIARTIRDAGLSLWNTAYAESVPVLLEVERACRWVVQSKFTCSATRIVPYGSYTMQASLEKLSDIDAVADITIANTCDGGDDSAAAMVPLSKQLEILVSITNRLHWLYPQAKSRVRQAGSPGDAPLLMLTVKLWPTAPSLDLLLCIRRQQELNTHYLTQHSAAADAGVQDSNVIQDLVRNQCLTDISIFQGALRLIKLWARRRQIYSAQTGFLGGGGWAVLLAWILLRGQGRPLAETPQELVCQFFSNVLSVLNERETVDVSKERISTDCDATDTATARCWEVLAPVSRGNLARNTTPSTVATICNEVRRAQGVLRQCDGNDLEDKLRRVMEPYIWTQNIPSGGAHVLQLVITSTEGNSPPSLSSSSPAERKAWASRQIISILVALDYEYGAGCVRPVATPERHKSSPYHKLVFSAVVSLTVAKSFLDEKICGDFNAKHASYSDQGFTAELSVCKAGGEKSLRRG